MEMNTGYLLAMDAPTIRSLFVSFLMLAAGYLALSPLVAMPVYNYLLFFPYRYPDGAYQVTAVAGVPRKEVFFPTADGKKLHGWLFSMPGARRMVLVSHGNAGNLTYRLYLAEALLSTGASVFLYDYQGYGRSEGTPSVGGICQDGAAAFKYLTESEHIPESDIVLYGESIGSGVSCHLSNGHKCAAIILQSGFSSLNKIAREKYLLFKLYPPSLFPEPTLDSLACVKKAHPPLLIIHGLADEIVPPEHARELFAQALEPRQLVLIPAVGHNDVQEHPQYLEAIKSFLAKLSPHR